jgi:hypothetical protein
LEADALLSVQKLAPSRFSIECEGHQFRMNLLQAMVTVCERGGVTMLSDRHIGRLECCQ